MPSIFKRRKILFSRRKREQKVGKKIKTPRNSSQEKQKSVRATEKQVLIERGLCWNIFFFIKCPLNKVYKVKKNINVFFKAKTSDIIVSFARPQIKQNIPFYLCAHPHFL